MLYIILQSITRQYHYDGCNIISQKLLFVNIVYETKRLI